MNANNYCAITTWTLLEYTGDIYKVIPLLNCYDLFKDITITQCCTICNSEEDGKYYLLVGYQIL